MPDLKTIVDYCNQRLSIPQIADFPGAENGLQFGSNGPITKVAACVDAGLHPVRAAIEQGADLLIVHHGLFWSPRIPVVESTFELYRELIDNNCAIYAAHLPLDCHKAIGNNALIAKQLGLEIVDWFLDYKGNSIAAIAKGITERSELEQKLKQAYPDTFTSIAYGSAKLDRIAILSGSGRSALDELKAQGTDTLITGELRQQHFNLAQEEGFNLYPCGHYATETHGVRALAEEVAEKFAIDSTFINMPCPL